MGLPEAYPHELVMDVPLPDGTMIHLRPIREDDTRRLQAFHSRLSRDSIFYRFFSNVAELTDERADYFTHIDYQRRLALVAIGVESGTEQIIAVGRYDLVDDNAAEFALVVEDRHQHRGIGRALLQALAEVARRRGVRRLIADVLVENSRMIRLLDTSGYPHRVQRVHDTLRFSLDLDSPVEESSRPTLQ